MRTRRTSIVVVVLVVTVERAGGENSSPRVVRRFTWWFLHAPASCLPNYFPVFYARPASSPQTIRPRASAVLCQCLAKRQEG